MTFSDTIFIVLTITSIGISLLFSIYLYENLKAPLTNSTLSTPQSTAAYNSFESKWSIFDSSLMIILIALVLGMIVSTFWLTSHPVLIVFEIASSILVTLLATVCSNLFYFIASVNPALTNIAVTYMPKTTHILSILGPISLIILAIGIITLFAKPGNQYSQAGYMG